MSEVVSYEPYITVVNAENLRVGKQLLTDDGWQTIRGAVVFSDADQVSIYTDERDDVETDGWRFHFGDRVQTKLTPTEEEKRQERRRVRMERKRQRRLAAEAANCPPWCIEHYDGTVGPDGAIGSVQRNHSSTPETVAGKDAWTDKPVEFEIWLERRDEQDTGVVETVGLLHTSILHEDVELTPEAMLRLAARLSSLAHRARAHR